MSQSVKKTFKYFLGVLLLYILLVLWPVRQFFLPSFLMGKQLLVFSNEAEARPCGGFVTAFGTVSFFPFEYTLKNSYHFEENNFGLSDFPLVAISQRKKFWDLGDTENLGICAKQFQNAYETATQEKIKNVILLDMDLVESLDQILKDSFWGQKKKTGDFFSKTSRLVSNVDRHDETALAERKKPLVLEGKKMIQKIIFQPHKWMKITHMIGHKIKNGDIFVPRISPIIERSPQDFSVIEWNLGGGKSSRFLQKNLTVHFYEKNPDEWQGFVKLSVRHLGGQDEPLSQKWKGVFAVHFPEFLNKRPVFLETEILPGEIFEKEFEFKEFKLDLSAIPHPEENINIQSQGRETEIKSASLREVSFFVPRGQKYNLDFTLSAFPQQTIESENMTILENTASFFGGLKGFRRTFNFGFYEDEVSPFVTLHEVVGFDMPASWEPYFPDFEASLLGGGYFFAEIHFNEKVQLNEDFGIRIEDRDFSLKEISETPVFESHKLLKDQTTLLLIFSQKNPQLEERFYLEILGVLDLWGREILPQKRTLITR